MASDSRSFSTTRPMWQPPLEAITPMTDEPPACDGRTVSIHIRQRSGAIVEAVKRLSDADIGVDDLTVRRPTLDDVFLTLTGHAAEAESEADSDDAPDGRHTNSKPDSRGADSRRRDSTHDGSRRGDESRAADEEERREAPRHRHAHHRRAQPDPAAASARAAPRLHRPADHVRFAVPLRVRRSDRDPGLHATWTS